MNHMDFLPYMEYQQHHDELLKEAEKSRMLKEAFTADRPRQQTKTKILAFLSNELSSIGFSLEMRYGGQNETGPRLNRQSNTSGSA